MSRSSGRRWVPGHQNEVERLKELEESIQREATAAGFANTTEYLNHRFAKNRRLCSVAYDLYNQCMSEDGAKKSHCDWYRNDCPEFK